MRNPSEIERPGSLVKLNYSRFHSKQPPPARLKLLNVDNCAGSSYFLPENSADEMFVNRSFWISRIESKIIHLDLTEDRIFWAVEWLRRIIRIKTSSFIACSSSRSSSPSARKISRKNCYLVSKFILLRWFIFTVSFYTDKVFHRNMKKMLPNHLREFLSPS